MRESDRERLLSSRKALAVSLDQVTAAVGELLAPLRRLSVEQRDAVLMLGLLMQNIALVKRPQAMSSEKNSTWSVRAWERSPSQRTPALRRPWPTRRP